MGEAGLGDVPFKAGIADYAADAWGGFGGGAPAPQALAHPLPPTNYLCILQNE
ncbi:MAG: hypothetical protein N3E49_01850 [Bacteroidia bacterium]|nr:hypothetical protein [Bacteroidia bacterium]